VKLLRTRVFKTVICIFSSPLSLLWKNWWNSYIWSGRENWPGLRSLFARTSPATTISSDWRTIGESDCASVSFLWNGHGSPEQTRRFWQVYRLHGLPRLPERCMVSRQCWSCGAQWWVLQWGKWFRGNLFHVTHAQKLVPLFFTFIWPCIVINFFTIKPTDALISKFILVRNSTCSG
jgi:hypothetical protein